MVPRLLPMVMGLLFASLGLVTAEDTVDIEAHLGSDLRLPIGTSNSNDSYRFDLLRGSQTIGSYDDEMQGRQGYVNRLTYDGKSRTITVKALTGQDGTEFTVKLSKDINGKSTLLVIKYRVTIRDPETSRPYIQDTNQIQSGHNAQNSTHHILRFTSFCLSLDSPVNALFIIGLSKIQRYYKQLEGKTIDFGYVIISIATIIVEIISIILSIFSSGNWYECLLVLIPIFLFFVIYRHFGKSPICVLEIRDHDNCRPEKLALYMYYCMLTIQFLFAVFTGIFLFYINQEISPSSEGLWCYIWIPVFISLALRIGVVLIVYWYNGGRFKRVSTNEPKTQPGDPEGIKEGEEMKVFLSLQDGPQDGT